MKKIKYLFNEEIIEIIREIKEILRMEKPYSKIPQIPILIEKYNNKIIDLLEEKAKPVKELIENNKASNTSCRRE